MLTMMILWLLSAKLCGCLNIRTAAVKTGLLIAIFIMVFFPMSGLTLYHPKPNLLSSDVNHRNTAKFQSGGAGIDGLKKIRW